jgi:hypothetical protein
MSDHLAIAFQQLGFQVLDESFGQATHLGAQPDMDNKQPKSSKDLKKKITK